MEEVWGEVDHMLNYPVPTDVLSSREQLKVLGQGDLWGNPVGRFHLPNSLSP
jgi:hypothetical protein